MIVICDRGNCFAFSKRASDEVRSVIRRGSMMDTTAKSNRVLYAMMTRKEKKFCRYKV